MIASGALPALLPAVRPAMVGSLVLLLVGSLVHHMFWRATSVRRPAMGANPEQRPTTSTARPRIDAMLRGLVRARRSRTVTIDAVAEWCDSVARDTSAGSTLRMALNRVPSDAPLAAATESVRTALDRGRSVAETMELLVTAPAVRDSGGAAALCLAGSVIIGVAEAGASASEPLRRVSGSLRLRSADRQERAAHSAQAQMSAHVLTVLPVATLTLLAASDPDVRAVVSSSIGVVLVGVGATLNATGWWWMRRIVERAT